MGNMYLTDSQKIIEEGFLAGYTSSTYAVVALIALGGLLVPLIIQQFDNLIKVVLSELLLSSSPLQSVTNGSYASLFRRVCQFDLLSMACVY